MRTVCKSFLALVFAALPLFMLGCGGGGGGGGDSIQNGALRLTARASAGNGAFAASVRPGSAAVRASVSSKYAARIKRIGYPPMIVMVDISTDRKELTLDKTIDGVPAGKQQVGIEIIASGSPDTSSPILKTYVTAEVAGGQTSTPPQAPINSETTAKALCFDTWTASTSKTIDDFTPPAASITAMAASISTVLGNGDLPCNSDFAFPAEITNGAKTISEIVKVVDDTPPATQNRLSGSYRYYEYAASSTFRWSCISDLTVSGNAWSAKGIFDSTGDELESTSTPFTETAGALTFANSPSARGAVSPSGNAFVTHNWQADDPYIGFGVKLPTNATKALMQGTWRVYHFAESLALPQRYPSAPKIIIETWTFDGNGNLTVNKVYADVAGSYVGDSFTGIYYVTSDGKVTLDNADTSDPRSCLQVSAGGDVFVGAADAGLSLGVKQGSGMSTANLAGNFTNVGMSAGQGSENYSSSWSGLVAFSSNGTGSYTNGKTENGPEADETFTRSVSADGLMDVTAEKTYGSLAPSGEVMVSFVADDTTARDINFAVRR